MKPERLAEIRDILDGNNGNTWWVLDSGDHQNIADDLLEAYDAQAERIAALEAVANDLGDALVEAIGWAAGRSDRDLTHWRNALKDFDAALDRWRAARSGAR